MTFDEFVSGVRGLLEPTAAGKGYNQTGVDGPNQLYEFVAETVGGNGHAIGEVIYKMRRFAAKGNPEDVLKAAAWCFLILKYHAPRRSYDDRLMDAKLCGCGDRLILPEQRLCSACAVVHAETIAPV